MGNMQGRLPNSPIESRMRIILWGGADGGRGRGEKKGGGIRSHICILDSCRCMQLSFSFSRSRGRQALEMLERPSGLTLKTNRNRTGAGGWRLLASRLIEMGGKMPMRPRLGI